MKTKAFEVKVTEYGQLKELPEADQHLLVNARESGRNAYSTYSGFKVGAAVLLANGEIIRGNNQENAAYPSGLCAERIALFYASAIFPGIPFKALAVSGIDSVAEMTIPCGSCLQVLSEYEDLAKQPVRIIIDGKNNVYVFEGIDNLLPFRFKKGDFL